MKKVNKLKANNGAPATRREVHPSTPEHEIPNSLKLLTMSGSKLEKLVDRLEETLVSALKPKNETETSIGVSLPISSTTVGNLISVEAARSEVMVRKLQSIISRLEL